MSIRNSKIYDDLFIYLSIYMLEAYLAYIYENIVYKILLVVRLPTINTCLFCWKKYKYLFHLRKSNSMFHLFSHFLTNTQIMHVYSMCMHGVMPPLIIVLFQYEVAHCCHVVMLSALSVVGFANLLSFAICKNCVIHNMQ